MIKLLRCITLSIISEEVYHGDNTKLQHILKLNQNLWFFLLQKDKILYLQTSYYKVIPPEIR